MGPGLGRMETPVGQSSDWSDAGAGLEEAWLGSRRSDDGGSSGLMGAQVRGAEVMRRCLMWSEMGRNPSWARWFGAEQHCGDA